MANGHEKAVWALAWSPDGKELATGSEDTKIIVWSFQEKKPRLELIGHTKSIAYLEWSPDGTRLASCSEDGTIKIWNTYNGACVSTINGYCGDILKPFPVKWSKDGSEFLVFTMDNELRSYNAQNWQSKKTPLKIDEKFIDQIEDEYATDFDANAIYSVSWDKEARFFALAEAECGEIFLFETGKYKCIGMTHSDGDSNYVSLSPDGKYVLCGPRKFHYVKIFKTTTLEEVATIDDSTEQDVNSVTWNPDGKSFALDSDYNSIIKVWDAETGECLMVLKSESKEGNDEESYHSFLSLGWHPDGIHIAAGDEKGNIIIWNIDTKKIESILECHKVISKEETPKEKSEQYIELKRTKIIVKNNELDLSHQDIKDISEIKGLEHLIDLRKLDLAANQISEIKGLEHIINLQRLDLGSNQITEIKGLENLTNLENLDLSYNKITAIKGLKNLIKLKTIWLNNNKIMEIKGLESLVNLQTIWLNNNKIMEIKGLEALVNLQILNLSDNQFAEIKALESLVNLQQLYLAQNKVKEIKGLAPLKNIKLLTLDDTEITELKGLENLVNLEELRIGCNQIPKDILDQCGGLKSGTYAIDPKKFVEYCRQKKKPEKKNSEQLSEVFSNEHARNEPNASDYEEPLELSASDKEEFLDILKKEFEEKRKK